PGALLCARAAKRHRTYRSIDISLEDYLRLQRYHERTRD
ncbi:MAG: hypothetical protein ACI9BW_003691, partial [Gammaproteobacteria bacterium]